MINASGTYIQLYRMSNARSLKKLYLSELWFMSYILIKAMFQLAFCIQNYIMKQRFLLNKLVKNFSTNERILEAALRKHYQKNQLLKGYCTEKGTQKFKSRNSRVHESNWKNPIALQQKLHLSSLGIGTQSGEPTPEADLKMFEVLVQSMKQGYINTIDTDVNFRYGKSEKTINAALNCLIKEHQFSRSQFFIATKCGYIMQDIDSQLSQQNVRELLLKEEYVEKSDIVNDIYCLHPNFINFTIQKSRLSLGLQTIDLMYLNNPFESLLAVVGAQELKKKLTKAFESLEQLRQDNKIRNYGIASFVSLRSPPNEEGVHASVHQITSIAKQVAGDNHGLRFILVPMNLGMPQALLDWQLDSNGKKISLFDSARQHSFNINLCCALFQGRLSKVPFETKLLDGLSSNSAKHLQLMRSIPKSNIVSTHHVIENTQVATNKLLTSEEWKQILPIQQ